MRPEFVGSVAGILNVACGYASGADSSPPAQDTNLTPLEYDVEMLSVDDLTILNNLNFSTIC